ncbi:M48 family metalloprotease [Parasphingorhabdus sp.]|uniref:M48 family metallopeptidase n=1 Tax=Parasphingorhabdus sp. TaxID=2709688 RepID=UPI003BB08D66|tara:strand:- start:496 stop:1695 length:1200 start_codon:yes stop_codon:yes gene_type:complete
MYSIAMRLNVLLLALTPSIVLADAPPLPPPYEGVYQPQGVDEVGFWQRDDESERALNNSPIVIRDEKLNTYLKQVLCEAVGPDRCGSTRIYVLREPIFNASMSPNGTMRVFSGLLLRVRSEAELASVLGHEFGHFEKRHSLERFKSARSGSDLLSWASLLASMSPSYQTRSSFQNLEFSVYGNLYRFKRDQEREADLLGLSYLNGSNFRPQAASEVWLNLMGEYEASARVRGLKKPRFNRIAFTASHPPQAERAEYLSDLADSEGAERDDGADRYREALADWIPKFLNDQIGLNDFGGSEYIINSLAEKGWTADLWFARGELYRLRGNQRDLVNAVNFYREAIVLNPEMADAYRGLGLSQLKTGQRTDGQAALAQYLALEPDASDAPMISMLLPKEKTE